MTMVCLGAVVVLLPGPHQDGRGRVVAVQDVPPSVVDREPICAQVGVASLPANSATQGCAAQYLTVASYPTLWCRVLRLKRCWVTDHGCIHLGSILAMPDIGIERLVLDFNL
jgi:hypothetical protein